VLFNSAPASGPELRTYTNTHYSSTDKEVSLKYKHS